MEAKKVSAAAKIRERVDLMRWSDRLEEEPPVEGSLSDVWWNKDVPALLEIAEAAAALIKSEPVRLGDADQIRLSNALERLR